MNRQSRARTPVRRLGRDVAPSRSRSRTRSRSRSRSREPLRRLPVRGVKKYNNFVERAAPAPAPVKNTGENVSIFRIFMVLFVRVMASPPLWLAITINTVVITFQFDVLDDDNPMKIHLDKIKHKKLKLYLCYFTPILRSLVNLPFLIFSCNQANWNWHFVSRKGVKNVITERAMNNAIWVRIFIYFSSCAILRSVEIPYIYLFMGIFCVMMTMINRQSFVMAVLSFILVLSVTLWLFCMYSTWMYVAHCSVE